MPFSTKRIAFASNNAHKLDEVRLLLRPHQLEVVSPRDLGIQLDVEETGASFEDNALLKATALRDLCDLVCIADDSGLVVDALNGEPGIQSARYGGMDASEMDRVQRILQRMSDTPDSRRTAMFVAAIALALPDGRNMVFRGEVNGIIADKPAGNMGFGYDPIFLYPGFGLTFAQVSAQQKATVSHRARAMEKALTFLRQADAEGILQ